MQCGSVTKMAALPIAVLCNGKETLTLKLIQRSRGWGKEGPLLLWNIIDIDENKVAGIRRLFSAQCRLLCGHGAICLAYY